MSDNKIEFGFKADDAELKRALEQANSGIAKIGSTLAGLQSKMNQAFGQGTLGSINTLTQSLDRLSTIIGKLDSQSSKLGASLSGAVGEATGIVDQFGRPVSTGGNIGGSGGFGGGGGGTPPRGQFDEDQPTVFYGKPAFKPEQFNAGTPATLLQQMGIMNTLGLAGGATLGAARAYDIYNYDLPLARSQYETFGVRAGMRGRVSDMLGREATQSPWDKAMAGIQSYGPALGAILTGASMLIPGGAAAQVATRLGIGVGGRLLAGLGLSGSGLLGMLSGPANYHQRRLAQAQKAIAASPYLKEGLDFFGDIPAMAGNAEQLYGREGFMNLLNQGVGYGPEIASDYIRRARAAGVDMDLTPQGGDVSRALWLQERMGGRGFVDMLTRRGMAVDGSAFTNFGNMVAGAGLGDRREIAERDILGDLAGQIGASSGQLYTNPEQVAAMYSSVLGYGGRAMAQGFSGENLRQVVSGVEGLGREMSSSDVYQLLGREKLAKLGITGYDASAIMNLNPFSASGKGKARAALEAFGITGDRADDFLGTGAEMTDRMGRSIERFSSLDEEGQAKFREATGASLGALAVSGNAVRAASRDVFAKGEFQTDGTGADAGVLTTGQEIAASESTANREFIKTVTQAGDLIKEYMIESAVKFREKLEEDRQKLLAPRINDLLNNGPARNNR